MISPALKLRERAFRVSREIPSRCSFEVCCDTERLSRPAADARGAVPLQELVHRAGVGSPAHGGPAGRLPQLQEPREGEHGRAA